MLFIGTLFVVAAVLALSVAVGAIALPDKAVRARLVAVPQGPGEESRSARLRQIEAPEEAAKYVATKGMLSRLGRNMMLAGHPTGWTMRNVILAKILIPVPILLLGSEIALTDATPIKVGLLAVVLVVAYFVPDLLLYSRAQERQEEMQRALPDILDKIVITIEAGLGFESALAKSATSATGPLADELVRTIQDIQLGMSRRAAYESLQDRVTSEDIHAFIRGIIQAEEHGSSISGMVRIQSAEMRVKRKLRAEAKAGQVSVKLLGPLMVCIFPVLFIVVLAPGIMNAMSTF